MKNFIQKRVADLKLYRLDKRREAQYIAQLQRQGWCNLDLWNLEHHLAEYMYPLLVRFFQQNRKAHCDTPQAKWDCIRKELLWTFERLSKDDVIEFQRGEGAKNSRKFAARVDRDLKRIRAGLHLLAEHWYELSS